MALVLEKEAFTLFSEASAKMKDPELKKVFDFLTGFERNHVQMIEKEPPRSDSSINGFERPKN